MRRVLVMLAAMALFGSRTHAQAADDKPTEIKGHFIGETISVFLRVEPEVQREADVCRQHRDTAGCAHFLPALDGGQRAEISASDSRDFIFDDGKLVRLTMSMDGTVDAAVADLTKKFGSRSRNTTILGQDDSGTKWENHLFVWDTPDACVSLYEDNNPSLQDRRPLLIVESREDHSREYTVSVKQLSVEAGSNIIPAKSSNLRSAAEGQSVFSPTVGAKTAAH